MLGEGLSSSDLSLSDEAMLGMTFEEFVFLGQELPTDITALSLRSYKPRVLEWITMCGPGMDQDKTAHAEGFRSAATDISTLLGQKDKTLARIDQLTAEFTKQVEKIEKTKKLMANRVSPTAPLGDADPRSKLLSEWVADKHLTARKPLSGAEGELKAIESQLDTKVLELLRLLCPKHEDDPDCDELMQDLSARFETMSVHSEALLGPSSEEGLPRMTGDQCPSKGDVSTGWAPEISSPCSPGSYSANRECNGGAQHLPKFVQVGRLQNPNVEMSMSIN